MTAAIVMPSHIFLQIPQNFVNIAGIFLRLYFSIDSFGRMVL